MEEPTQEYVQQNKQQSLKLLEWCDQMEAGLKDKLQQADLPESEREKAERLIERIAEDREKAHRRIAELDRYTNEQSQQ